MRLKSGLLALPIAVLVGTLTSCSNSVSGAASGTAFMWIATAGDQMLSSYTIDLSNGGVSSARSSVASGPNPSTMALTPDGTTLFLADSDGIHIFTVASDGTVKASTAATLPLPNPSAGSVSLAIDPAGTFLFVADQGNAGVLGTPGAVAGTISVFSIANLSNPPVVFPTKLSGDVTGNGPSALAIPSSGGYLYVADQFSSVLAAYSYDSSGNLTFLNSYPVPANPSALAFSRVPANSNRDNYLIVANNTNSSQAAVFNACVATTVSCAAPDGLLTQVGSPVSTNGSEAVGIIVDPQFDFVYVIDEKSNQMSQFAFAGATGALTALSPATASTGSSPVSGGVTPDGNWVYVANNGQSTLSAFAVSSAGKLSPASTTVILSNQPSAVLVR